MIIQVKSDKKKRPYLWAGIYGTVLLLYTGLTLMDAFVIPRDIVNMNELNSNSSYTVSNETATNENSQITSDTSSHNDDISDSATQSTTAATNTQHGETDESTITQSSHAGNNSSDTVTEKTSPSTSDSSTKNISTTTTAKSITTSKQPTEASKPKEPVITDKSYVSENISIEIKTERINDTNVYIADVKLKDAANLRTGLAGNSFGRNVTARTSAIAEECNAILAINGDFYGFRSKGFVMRNGYLYRETARDDSDSEALVIYEQGNFEIVNEKNSNAKQLADAGAVQIFTFGPGLVKSGEIAVSENSEVEQSMTSNPRTAIGIIDNLHYMLVVSDGRTDESEGLTLYQLADVMKNFGCKTAYNLDGGGSATMWFMGKIINVPTTDGIRIKERKVSDIVYIGE